MSTPNEAASPAEVLDPVCGMTIDPADAVGHTEYRGRTYYFCAQSCLDAFVADPEQYLDPQFSAQLMSETTSETVDDELAGVPAKYKANLVDE